MNREYACKDDCNLRGYISTPYNTTRKIGDSRSMYAKNNLSVTNQDIKELEDFFKDMPDISPDLITTEKLHKMIEFKKLLMDDIYNQSKIQP